MITKNNNKTKKAWNMLRKMSVIPATLIALYAFAIQPTDMPASGRFAVNRPPSESIRQVPWTPQNEIDECVIIVGYTSEITPKEVKATYSKDLKMAPGAISYNVVQQRPVPKDNTKHYMRFLSEHVCYPTIAAENGITGKVAVSFVIDKNGKVTDVKSPLWIDILSKEAERVIKLLPDWEPGIHDGKKVAVQYYQFFEFKLQK